MNEFRVAMISVFENQVTNGHWSLVRISVKLSSENLDGKRQDSAASPCFSGGQAPVSVLPPENASVIR
jgi:hypothetical protein